MSIEDRCAPAECPIPEQSRRWWLDRSLNVGHLLTTLALASGIVAWGNKLDSRVAVLEAQRAEQTKKDEAQDGAVKDRMSELRQDLMRIEQKLDRVIEMPRR